MSLKHTGMPSGRKLAPRSAVSKSGTVKKSASSRKNAGSVPSKSGAKKARRHPAAFSTQKSRQLAVARAKLQIWRHLDEINGAVIKLAESGSYLAARTLFDFAGVYNLPPLDEEGMPTCLPSAPAGEAAPPASPEKVAPPVNRVEAFLKTLGLDALADDEPEPDVAA
jgi:hypothetical protein